MLRTDLESRFHDEMLRIYDRASVLGYRPTRFKQMVERHGGVEAARRLLKGDKMSGGFARLRTMGMSNISVEALVLREPWRKLFTAKELEQAQRRLE